jgi:hypothetical protein
VGKELSRSNAGHENSDLIKEQQKETHKVVKILRLVVTAFAILVLPIHLLFVWIDFFDGGKKSMTTTFPFYYIPMDNFQTFKFTVRFFPLPASSSNYPMIRVISVVMLYSNSASNPILYNICNEQFRDGFKKYFKPCSRTLCPGMNCKEEEYSNETKESDFISLVYHSPKTRLSVISQNSSARSSLLQNGKCMSVSFEEEKKEQKQDPCISFV